MIMNTQVSERAKRAQLLVHIMMPGRVRTCTREVRVNGQWLLSIQCNQYLNRCDVITYVLTADGVFIPGHCGGERELACG